MTSILSCFTKALPLVCSVIDILFENFLRGVDKQITVSQLFHRPVERALGGRVGRVSEMFFKNRANQKRFFLTVHRLTVTGVDCLLPLEGDLFLIAYCHMTEGHLTGRRIYFKAFIVTI